jgi:hypothetical protein
VKEILLHQKRSLKKTWKRTSLMNHHSNRTPLKKRKNLVKPSFKRSLLPKKSSSNSNNAKAKNQLNLEHPNLTIIHKTRLMSKRSFSTSRRRSIRLQQGLQRKIFIMKLVVFLKAEGRSKTWTRLGLLNFMISVIRCLLNLISLSNCKILERMTRSDSMTSKANRNWLLDLKRLQDHHGLQLIFLTSLEHQNIKKLSRNQSQSQNSHLLFQHNKRNPADLWKNHQMKAANRRTNNTGSKALCVSNIDRIQRTTRHSALNKPVVVDLSR